MVESEPKKLFVSLPVLFVSANTKSDQVRTWPTCFELPCRVEYEGEVPTSHRMQKGAFFGQQGDGKTKDCFSHAVRIR